MNVLLDTCVIIDYLIPGMGREEAQGNGSGWSFWDAMFFSPRTKRINI